jgi:hypothetical protein
MIHNIKVTIVGSHEEDGTILPSDIMEAFSTEFSEFEAFGMGGKWHSAGFILFWLTLKDFDDKAEPSEAFMQSMRARIMSLAVWLSSVPTESAQKLVRRKFVVQLVIDLFIDQNQMDLDLPWELLREAGRLKLPIKIVSND